jgi:hypothetical protein
MTATKRLRSDGRDHGGARASRPPLRGILFAAASLAVAPSAAGAEPRWDPGHSTTSTLPHEVRADDIESSSDGVYGRFEAPFDLAVDLGAEIGQSGAGAAIRTSLHYFSMAGIYAGYADALGGDWREGSRLVSFGVDARPAFIPRWSKNWEQGSGFLDLAIDSISLGLGAYFRSPPSGKMGDARGFELSLGVGVPLTARALGPWIGARGLLRWDDPRGTDVAVKASVLATLGWDFAVGG